MRSARSATYRGRAPGQEPRPSSGTHRVPGAFIDCQAPWPAALRAAQGEYSQGCLRSRNSVSPMMSWLISSICAISCGGGCLRSPSRATVTLPMTSGRNAAHSSGFCAMSSRARSGSLPRPSITWDEACRARIAVDVDDNVTAVAEDDLAGEQLAGLHPPLVLLGPDTVAPGRLLRLEAGQRDELAIPGQPGGASEPAGAPAASCPDHRSSASCICSGSVTWPRIT